MPKTITRLAYLQLLGLEHLANKHLAVVTNCGAAMDELLGLEPGDDHVLDMIHGGKDLAWLLRQLDVEVAH